MTIASCAACCIFCLTYKEPVMALMLSKYNLDVTQIGLIFSLDTVTYTITSFLLNFVKGERNGMKYGMIQFAGMLFFTACMMGQGPAPFLPK